MRNKMSLFTGEADLGCAGGSSSELGPCESKEAHYNPLYLFEIRVNTALAAYR